MTNPEEAIEPAAECGDTGELRKCAAAGHSDAVDLLVELATEREDHDELRRLAAGGGRTSAEVLAELEDE
ncbi:MAG TPA: hypothetical protein VGL47_10765 [Amycolatopsis sp.]|uniref:Ankyrin repeat domain-containing protein n=1 Tax=Amycolatopsis nalaikhensis TaxID=715472 RepID=A0ABY8XZ60_9PSEU|nr:hypothetical protein [Amycolatopsis sp. 2-2]WIV61024.1 hypothetical protein QP939_21700 [Amycolatopsis sp. 2-2]